MDDRKSGPAGPGRAIWLPAGAGVIALVLYLITLNPWMTFGNATDVALTGGWAWTVEDNVFNPPLLHLVTTPIRLLPVSIQPYALNVLSSLFMAGAAFFLAWTIRLLPQDRTRDQRVRERSPRGLLSGPFWWAPVCAGTALFLFQLTVWESATLFSRESINAFIFSVIVWSIFRARIDNPDLYLRITAFMTGIGLANDGGLIGFLPFIGAAFIWLRKKELFQFSVFVPIFGCFITGCILYLLVPIIHPYRGVDDIGYWERLISYLGTQKSYILFRGFRIPNFFLSLTSVLPVVFATVRWPSQFGDMTAIGAMATQAIFRVFHLIFLGMAFYVSFDPEFSPRQSGAPGLLYLRYQFLTSLAAGYYLGYFLLLLSRQGETRRKKRPVVSAQLGGALAWALTAISVALPLALVWKNIGYIQARNLTPWKPYVQSMADGVTANSSGAGFISSNSIFGGPSRQLLMLHTLLPAEVSGRMILMDASPGYLRNPEYHRFLEKKHGDRYPDLPEIDEERNMHSVDAITRHFTSLSADREGYYLNPTFGMFFEIVKAYPEGASYLLEQYKRDRIAYPVLNDDQKKEMEDFAAFAEDRLVGPLVKAADSNPPQSGGSGSGQRRFTDARLMGILLSGHLNDLGYRLMRSGHYQLARRYFDMSMEVDGDNLCAQINKYSSTLLEKRDAGNERIEWELPEDMKKDINDKLGGIERLEVLLNNYGFVDYPAQTFMLSRTFFENGLPLQGYQFLERTLELQPDDYHYYADGAMFVLNFGRADVARQILERLEKNLPPEELPFEDQNLALKIRAQIMQMESSRLKAGGKDEEAAEKFNEAVSLLRNSAEAEPQRESTLRFLATVYERAGQHDRVIETCTEQLEKFPNDYRALLQLGLAHGFRDEFGEAIEANNRALEINPEFWEAHKNNAFIYSRMGDLDKAIESLKAFRRIKPGYNTGLLEIARLYRSKGDAASAAKYYEEYLLTVMKGSVEALKAQSELEELDLPDDEG